MLTLYNMDLFMWGSLLVVLALTVSGIIFKKNSLNLPGPNGIPFIGNFHQLNAPKLHVQLLKWARRYGPVYSIWLGRKPVVIVTGSKQIHEVLVVRGKEFSGRSKYYVTSKLTCDAKDIGIGDPNQEWRVQKTLFMRTLKAYGTGFHRIEEITVRYTNQWIKMIENSYDDVKGLEIRDHLFDLTYDILNTIAMRESLHTERNARKIKQLVQDNISIFKRDLQFEGILLNKFPVLRFIMTSISKDIERFTEDLRSLYMELKKKELVFMDNDDTKDPSEQLLLSQLIQYQLGNDEVKLDEDREMWTLFNIFGPGMGTTTISFSFLFNILAQNRDIQMKIVEEIDRVIGQEAITLADRERMPYTQATLLEMLRFTSILPILVPHCTIAPTSIGSHHIPKGTEVWVNAWGLHHDDAVWDKPFQFIPERFLDASDALVLADHPSRKNLVAMGAGPRVCAGETFAMSRMFLILTMFLQKFSVLPFSPDGDQPTYDTRDIDMGLVLDPPAYKLKLQSRG